MCKALKGGGKNPASKNSRKKKILQKVTVFTKSFVFCCLGFFFPSKSSRRLPNTKHQFSWPDFWQVCYLILPQASSARPPAEASLWNSSQIKKSTGTLGRHLPEATFPASPIQGTIQVLGSTPQEQARHLKCENDAVLVQIRAETWQNISRALTKHFSS